MKFKFYILICLACIPVFGQEQLILNIDYTQTQVLTNRAELYLEVNKGENFNAEVWLEARPFSSNVSATIPFDENSPAFLNLKVADISEQENFNLKAFNYNWTNLTPQTSYEYRWLLKAQAGWTKGTEWIQITTTDGFGVVADQLFELPEEGLIPGDTIGILKYENSFEKWKKVQTYYKTTFALKPNGELYGWGRNVNNSVAAFAREGEGVVYGQARVTREPFTRGNHDYDFDGFFDEDEYISGTDVFDPNDYPQIDTDGDYLSDAFEELKGLDPTVPWLGGRRWFDWMYPLNQKTIPTTDNEQWWAGYDWDTHNSIWYEDGPNSYNVRKDENDIFGMFASDFAVHEYTRYAINKFTGELFAWGYDEAGNQWNCNTSDKPCYANIAYPTFFSRTKAPNLKFHKIFTGLNTDWGSFVGNPKNPMGWDNPVVAIDEDGNMYAWGVVNGVVIDYPMPIGEGSKWIDVAVADNLMAIRDDGYLFELGTDIPVSTKKIQQDTDGDGVPDIDDPFPWDPNAYADSDNDGAADNWEENWMQTDPNDPDSDGDGYLDGEDQLPLDPLYYADKDWDGLPDELDPDDNNPDVDNDGARDGDDADFYDDDPNYINPNRRWDCDRDGVSDEEEWARGSDACTLDTDGDGIEDKLDIFPRSYYYSQDSDGDGIPNRLEETNGSDPNNEDSDGDGYKDGITQATQNEIWSQLRSLDCDIDCNHWEYFWRFWDLNRDCNGDGEISQDEWEFESDACFNGENIRDMYPTDPEAYRNSDWDDMHDGIDPDDDNDGVSDLDEIRLGTNPLRWDSKPEDSDGDNVPDIIEKEKGLDPYNRDSDGDGAWDGWDSWPSDPSIRHDQDLDRIEDWAEEEYFGTDPNNADTDGDGVNDNIDAFPLDSSYTIDTDGDGLSDEQEDELGYNKNSKDTDGDGYYDAPCNADKLVYWTDEYGNSWWDTNWRECEGYWSRVDTDGDGLWNDEDDDIDGDGILNDDDNDWYDWWQYNESAWQGDAFPKDPNEWEDSDGDGIGNNADDDDDNDGVLDQDDDYPNDARYTKNTDKPTVDNGGLTDWNNNGIFGEDYGNDGWIDEMDHQHFDFIPDEIDEDDDGDLFLDEDEIFNNTDSKDKSDFPGIGFTDTDKDGVSNNYEISVGSDPNNWDTDGDGISDGWRFPNENHNNGRANRTLVWDMIDVNATSIDGDEYEVYFHGNNQDHDDRISHQYRPNQGTSAGEILNYFKDYINQNNEVKYNNSIGTINLTATVSGSTLLVQTDDNDWSFYYKFTRVIIDDGKLVTMEDNHQNSHRSHQWKEDFQNNNRSFEWGHNEYRYNKGVVEWNGDELPYLRDMFPNDPTEYWDTDGDGTGDNSDNDIDGDGLANADDDNPFTPTSDIVDQTDTDRDGVLDIYDEDDDNDDFLDVDEEYNNTDSKDRNERPSNDIDSDNDGFSDSYETAVLQSDPTKWDTDGDGVSDGWKYPKKTSYGYGSWQNEFFVDRESTIPDGDEWGTYEDYYYNPNHGTSASWNANPYFIDAFPNDPNEYWDTDGDGTGDNSDPDIDGDGIANAQDPLPYSNDTDAVADDDSDGVPNYLDNDDDGNGRFDDDSSWSSGDNDGDGLSNDYEESIGTNKDDWDTDGDGISDGFRFPQSYGGNFWHSPGWYDNPSKKSSFIDYRQSSPTEQSWDWYRYYKGRIEWSAQFPLMLYDMFPNNPNEFWDTDGDGTGDNSDDDIDGDGIANEDDDLPFDKENLIDTDNDNRPDNIDMDDDDDGELDVDEEHLGTDPLDRESNNSSVDPDNDGLSTAYELSIETDPNDWDSDDDGISDGWKHPDYHWQEAKWYIIFQIQDESAVLDQNEDSFRIRINGHNSDWQDRLEIVYHLEGQTRTGDDMLNYFSDRINQAGFVYSNRREEKEYFESFVDGNKLVIRTTEGKTNNNMNLYFDAFTTITDNGVIYKLNDQWRQYDLKNIYYFQYEPMSDGMGSRYNVVNGNIGHDQNYKLLMDMFPNDPDEYWDTDEDGIGDFSDDDIDGDDVSNSEDQVPFDSRDSKDTDNDGISDSFDSNIDGDNFLNFDEEANGTDPNVYTPEDGGLDSDRDGLSDPYEESRGSDPENWDTDGDGVSDGWRYPNTCGHWDWSSDQTWKDEFFRERSFDCGDNFYYFREGRIDYSQEEGGKLFIDAFPTDANEYWDTDGDGIGDNSDDDIDGDGSLNSEERSIVSNGPSYYDDFLRRGVKSNIYDPDTDDDGVLDGKDEAPMDDKSVKDTDGDGRGDQSDSDIDGDGISNTEEEKLGLDVKNWDSDGDGYSDGCEVPGFPRRNNDDLWQIAFSLQGSSTLEGDNIRLNFNNHGDNWDDKAQRIENIAEKGLSPEEFAQQIKNTLDNHDFPRRFSQFTTTVSGSTVILTGVKEENAQVLEYVEETNDANAGGTTGLYNFDFQNGGRIKIKAKVDENSSVAFRFMLLGWNSTTESEDRYLTDFYTVNSDSYQEIDINIPNQQNIDFTDITLVLQDVGTRIFYEFIHVDQYDENGNLPGAQGINRLNPSVDQYQSYDRGDWSSFHVYPDVDASLKVIWYSGCENTNEDKFKLDPDEWRDYDNDNIGDNKDLDDDNDGLTDQEEAEIGTNPYNGDTDNDCHGDMWDAFPLDPLKGEDWDKDGIVDYVIKDPDGNIVKWCERWRVDNDPNSGYYAEYVDDDTDNDGLSNEEENLIHNDLERQENNWNQELFHRWWNTNIDVDGDGFKDGEDAFPREGRFHSDLDGDKHPDLWDPDVDGDGFRNKDEEANGTDPKDADSFPTEDNDGDKVSDKYELIINTELDNQDTDGDGYKDNVDDYPLNVNEWSDYNNNGWPDNLDRNDDDDDLPDFVEIWLGLNEKSVGDRSWDHFRPSEDPDNDRVPTALENERGSDPNLNDTDFDGCDDSWDEMPTDSSGCEDLDGDGIGNHQDDDMDGDGLTNDEERSEFYDTYEEYPDSDGDGVVDGEDYAPKDKRIQEKEDVNAVLFSFTQIGSNKWKDISSWNFNQQAGSYAGVDADGDLYFWGTNFGGFPIIPDSETEERWRNGEDYSYPIFEPQRFSSSYKFNGVVLGKKFGLAYTVDGEIVSWGTNLSSQLAKGNISTFEKFSKPKTPIKNIELLTAGDQQAGALNIDGKLRMFGSNDSGQLGTEATNPNTPQELSWDGIEDIKKVIVTETETFILTENGDLWSYGDNVYGQLGRGYRSVRADDYTHKKSINGDWQDIYASSGKFYGFKNTDGSLWVWGKNSKYDLGIGRKSNFELDPVKVQGVNFNQIKDFTITREGFAYITNDGELFGAGQNFFSGSWVPLRTPKRVGTGSDWKKFFDASGSKINLLVQKEDNSIWGAGANWNGNLGEPCPENSTKIISVEFTHPQVHEIVGLTLTQSNTDVDYLVSINSNIVSLTASNSALFVDGLRNIIESGTVSELVELQVNPASDLDEPSSISFEAKSLMDLQISISYSATDSNVTDLTGIVSHSLNTLQQPSFGTATYTLLVNGNRIETSADSADDALTNMQVALNNSNQLDQGEYSFTVTNSLLYIENQYYNEFVVTNEVQNSTFSQGEVTIETTQNKSYVDCNNAWLNDLYQIYDNTNQIRDISMGLFHTILLMNDGTIRSMGANHYGQLGRTGDWRSDLQIGDKNNWVKIKASERVSFAINSDGEMYAWGNNNYGQLGVGNFIRQRTPKKVVSSTPSLTIDWSGSGENLGGFDFQIARDNQGNAYGWGYKKFGKLGALGKLKADVVGWNVDDAQMDGIVDFDQETDYLIASDELVNNLAQVNFENYTPPLGDGGSAKSIGRSKGSVVFNPEGYKTKQTKFKTNPSNSGKKKITTRGVGKWKVKKKVNAFTGAASIFNGESSSAITQFQFAVVDVNERPEDITLSSNELTIESENQLLTIGTIEVVDPDQDDEITVSLSPNSQNTNLFEIDQRGLHLIAGNDNTISGEFDIIIRATDFEGLSYEEAFIITINNNSISEIEEVESQENFLSDPGGGSSYNPRYQDMDGDGVTDYNEYRAGTDPRNFEDFPTDIDRDGIYDFEDGDIDNDGVLNENDVFPNDPTENADTDGDGIGDNADQDSDNDGVLDVDIDWRGESFTYDAFPNDPTESIDTDNDGIGNNGDDDDDDDGYIDANDAFPLDASEWADTDNDSIGDNTDEDIDGDNYLNIHEEQAGSDPFDPNSVPADLDGDFFPDTIDLDIDGDGILNEFDTAPNFANPNQEYLPNDPNYISIEVAEFFSPNGDGINDTWTFPEIQRFPLNQVWIYASDGTLVFHEQSYANTWDGTFNGGVLPVGSYLYRVDVDGNGTIDFEGWLYLSD